MNEPQDLTKHNMTKSPRWGGFQPILAEVWVVVVVVVLCGGSCCLAKMPVIASWWIDVTVFVDRKGGRVVVWIVAKMHCMAWLK